ncbi:MULTISPECIES: rhodanese-like domain-containing protein [Vibrio]|uniref:Rhodanese-like domain-containing protein n=1 Tax=Vibrio algicola TaxID=2662262 RepID=A0A5Q0THX1_9VIBR|nr:MULTISPECIES: rhodanese-like domain-containing protein [Vibrio]MBD1576983.1 rhodanese-like domain-containing protein [Vibrio sp. S11_S32]
MNIKNMLKGSLVSLVLLFPLLAQAESVWIDVRSPAEYKVDHIQGDVFIPHTQILDKVSKLYPDPETEIHLYCRSGNRAGIAKSVLNKAGYNKVFNEGSIEDARKARGLETSKPD